MLAQLQEAAQKAVYALRTDNDQHQLKFPMCLIPQEKILLWNSL